MKRVLLLLLMFTAGCAPRSVPKAEIPAVPIRRIAVQNFQGEGGAEARRLFVLALKGGGMAVVANAKDADAQVTGQMTDYQAKRKLTIFLGPTQIQPAGDSSAKASNPIFSLNTPQNVAQISAINPGNPQIVHETAVAGMVVRLQAISGGKLLWGDQFVYEALDLPTALQIVTGALAGALQRAVPGLKR